MFKRTIIERAIQKSTDELANAKKEKKRIKKFIEEYEDEINRIMAGTENLLEWFINAAIDTSSDSLDLSYAGDKHTIEGIYRAFRKLGYKTDKHLTKPEAVFTCYWDHKESDMRIWLRFSSTVCKRVKVGTKMVETDVFETRCD